MMQQLDLPEASFGEDLLGENVGDLRGRTIRSKSTRGRRSVSWKEAMRGKRCWRVGAAESRARGKKARKEKRDEPS